MTTSISLEEGLWDELDRQASENGQKWQEYMRGLLSSCPAGANRASFIRSSLVRNLRMGLDCSLNSASIPRSTWVLTGKNGVVRYDFAKNCILIGRSKDNDIYLDDLSVSKRHVMLTYDGIQWWAIDMNSKNGTFDSKGNAVEKKIFTHGDKLLFGDNNELMNISI